MSLTMKELAQRAGVSRPVVSAVLNNSSICWVSEATRQRVLELAKELDFIPNHAARQLNGGKSGLIGMIIIAQHLGPCSILQNEASELLQKNGFDILSTKWSRSQKGDMERTMRMFRSRRVDGVMAFSLDEPVKQFENLKIPIVYCSHNNAFGFNVGCDIEYGGYIAAKHLIEVHGYRRLAFLGTAVEHKMDFSPEKPYHASILSKHRGMCKALEEHGLKMGNTLWVNVNSDDEAMLKYFKKQKIEAVLCGNDFAAAELLKLLQDRGIKVPDDLAVVGFDGYSFCKYTPVTLATVVQPIYDEAAIAVNLLLEQINGKEINDKLENIMLQPHFQPGASCGCPEAMPAPKVRGVAYSMLMDEKLITTKESGL